MSLNYEDVVVRDNLDKIFWCRLSEDGGEDLVRMLVGFSNTLDDFVVVLYHWDKDNDEEYRKEDVLEIIEEVVEDGDSNDYDDPDGEFPVDFEAIKHLHYEGDVYRFNNKGDLILLYKSMNEPMIAGVWNDDSYMDKLDEGVFGMVYYWTEYDDWSCGHPYSYHMKIIFGVK